VTPDVDAGRRSRWLLVADADEGRWHRSLIVVDLAFRFLLGAVFLMAGASKLLNVHEFQDRLVVQGGFPTWAADPIGYFLPWLELTCGFCLVAGVARREAAALCGALLIAFTVYTLIRPARADCGCLLFARPPSADESRWWPVTRNLMLLMCATRTAWSSPPGVKTRANSCAHPASVHGSANAVDQEKTHG
jgi:uncharacterized membrane protein YphA (DoxX/SURF4 family)